jgi:hypothetical protein
MGQALNTTVNGSSGTCVSAADWLHTVVAAGHQAAGNVRAAHTGAEAGWQGPASQAFQDSISNVDVVADQMADWASRTSGVCGTSRPRWMLWSLECRRRSAKPWRAG